MEYDDSGLRSALRDYLDLRKNVDPGKELKKRAINIGYKLIIIYVRTGADKEEIMQAVKALGWRVKTRLKIRQRTRVGKKGKPVKLTRQQQILMEMKARANAASFTSTGWFTAITALGGNPRRALKKKFKGPVRGDIKQSLRGTDPFIQLENLQPAAELVANRDGGAIQKALDEERDDILVYVMRKQDEAAAKNGL